MMNKIKINDTTIRDIFQNIEFKNISINKYKKIFELLDKTGFDSIEAWGGASFEELLNNSFNKNPWDFLREIREIITITPIQASLGAKNLAGYTYFTNDIIKKFIKLSVEAGISKFRIFDALNDINNMKFTINEIVETGSWCEGVIIFERTKPVDFYVQFCSNLKNLGCKSICIKDAESVLTPSLINEYFPLISSSTDMTLFISSKNLKNLQITNYLEALKSGFNGVDLSFIPSTYSEIDIPSIFTFMSCLKGMDLEIKLDMKLAKNIFELIKNKVFPILKKNNKMFDFLLTDENISTPPKWLINAIIRQLIEIGEVDRIDEILEEMIYIKAESGNPTFASPIGHVIASQAILNTVFGGKWEIISDEMACLLKGGYGSTGETINKDLYERIKDININEGFQNKVNYEICKKEMTKFSQKEEDIISYCLFPEKTMQLFQKKTKSIDTATDITEIQRHVTKREEKMNDFDNSDIEKIKQIIELLENSNLNEITLEKNDKKIKLSKSTDKIRMTNLENESINIKDISDNIIKKVKSNNSEFEEYKDQQIDKSLIDIKSPIVGTFYSAPGPQEKPFVTLGQRVLKGDVLCIIEAMKLMNKITSEFEGTIEEILVKNEEPVDYGKVLMKIRIKE